MKRDLLRAAVPGDNIPSEFDCRTAWGHGILSPTLDQAQCGSCFIFSSTGVLRNRLAIAGRNGNIPNPSQQIALECNPQTNDCQNGGGDPETIFQWMSDQEIHVPADSVQGGRYTSGTSGNVPTCPARNYNQGFRGNQDHPVNIANIQYTPGQRINTNPKDPVIDDIKREIMTSGPAATIYAVYDDMMNAWYNWGPDQVYSYNGGSKYDGLHAVQIIGWGSKPTPYWLIMNSWGMGGIHGDGTFKAAIGTNGVGFEKYVAAIDVSNARDLYQQNGWQWNADGAQPGAMVASKQNNAWVWYVVTVGLILFVLIAFHMWQRAS